jgi:hypothetical protein
MCGEAIRDSGVELSDGRAVCHTCHRDGRNTIAEVEAVRQEVLQTMAEFGMTFAHPAPVKVADADEMARIAGHAWRPSVHHDARAMGAYSVARDGEQIIVESGQPRGRLVWTLAHEAAHDWHADQNDAFALLDEHITEGFAQWAAEEVARRLGLARMVRQQLDRRDVYGLAPAAFFRIEFLAGIPELLAFARHVGAARLQRLDGEAARGNRIAVERELEGGYTRWQKARDFAADAERFARRGYVFASAFCCREAVRVWPTHPALIRHWLGRHARNFLSLLTFTVGRVRSSLAAWAVLLFLVLLTGQLIYWL